MRINFDQFSIEKFGTLIELPAQQKPGKYIPKVFHTYDPDLKGNHYNIDNIKLVQTTRVAVLNGRRRLKLSYKPRYTWRTDDKSYDPNDTMPYPTMFVSGKQKWDMAEAPFGSIPDKAFPQHSVNGIALVVQASKDTVIDYTNFIVIRCYGRRNGAKYTEQIVST
ncbi:hypothetical protein AB0R99_00010 [Erwinia amylovora]|uniref:hypothetical protein n=1 Tax=Erwinia amylovora TaxID=552 RepID=UPI0037DDA827